MNQNAFDEAEKLFSELGSIYDWNFVELFSKAQDVAQKMLQGGELSPEEEESLLMKWAT